MQNSLERVVRDTNDCADQNDAQSWYLLGRCYMAQQKYPKAYEAYQQAVYRDGRNPTFWCSIGVLYYQINQYRDALDAYSRAIRLNPNISEVWYDLGTLVRGIQINLFCVPRTDHSQYESCNNQTADALDAYQRAADLDPTNVHIKARLQLLQNGQPTSGMPNQNTAPLPQDVHPQAYQPAAVNGPPGPQWGAPAPSQAPQSQPPPALDYGRRLADIQQHPQPVQQLTPYDQRDGVRPPIPPPPPRPASPGRNQDSMRHYPEPPRANVTPRRGMSPSPKSQNAAPPYGASSVPLPPPPPLPQSQSSQVNRITNPNYGPAAAIPPLPPPPPPRDSSPHGSMSVHAHITPPPEVRPILEQRPSSAGSAPYSAHSTGQSGIATGAPPPASALAAAEEAARNRLDERTPSGPKRLRDYEDELKAMSNDEKRQRLDEHGGRPASVPDRHPSSTTSPPTARRSLDHDNDHRRALANSENYHPSEAAHRPPPVGPAPSSLPALNAITPNGAAAAAAAAAASQPAPLLPMADAPLVKGEDVRERVPSGSAAPAAPVARVEEPPARKMEVDEDYDDDGDVPDRERPKGEGSPVAAAAVA